MESFLADLSEPASGLSPTEMLAARLRSALATNAMGGRVSEETKWRAATDAVKDAQVAWQRLAPTSSSEAQALTSRFREACRKITDRSRRQSQAAPPRRHERQEEAAAV